MAYTPYGWQNPYYTQPMPDNLAQLRQQQMPPMMAPQPPQNPVAQSGVQWVSGELVERTETPRTASHKNDVEFVTRKEFDALAALVGELKGKKAKEDNADG